MRRHRRQKRAKKARRRKEAGGYQPGSARAVGGEKVAVRAARVQQCSVAANPVL